MIQSIRLNLKPLKYITLGFLLGISSYIPAISQQAAENPNHIRFNKKQIAAESYESVSVFDVNGDDELDIVSGAFWYKGPEFLDRFYIGEIVRHGEYWDDFMNVPMDVNGDGRLDFVTGGWFNKTLRWFENPGDGSPWTAHVLDQSGNVETGRGWDVDGDGNLEIVPNNPNQPLKFYKLERDKGGKSTGSFTKLEIFPTQNHGLGFGDVNGDGRGDFIISKGWIETPRDIDHGKWILHEEFDFGSASIPILVVDVNGDSKNDLIVGQAHGYGLDWYEQVMDTNGNRSWKKHSIDSENSQYHTLEWVDLDGDGTHELVTGKRYRAHNGKDPGGKDLIGLYYFKWNGKSFEKNTISYGPLGEGKGTGINMAIVDLNRSGRPDIVVAGKDGLYVFYNQGARIKID